MLPGNNQPFSDKIESVAKLNVKYRDQDGTLIMARLSKISETNDRSFDLEFWQEQTDTERFNAAWEMVEFAHSIKGGDPNELKLHRSVGGLKRRVS